MKNTNFDIIGDIHGNARVLERLLKKLGYERTSEKDTYRHKERTAIFVGDLIDRGNENFKTLKIVKQMTDEGSALIVMGNHEYNALCFHTKNEKGEFLRPHTPKNTGQHKAVLAEIEIQGEETWDYFLDWFRRMPLFLELNGIRVVHACWKQSLIDKLERMNYRDDRGYLTDGFLFESSIKGTEAFTIVDTLLKGEEIRLPDSHVGIEDKDGNIRKKMRLKWWLSHEEKLNITTYDEGVRSDNKSLEKIKGIPIPHDLLAEIRDNDWNLKLNTPVFFGHYWFTGLAEPLNNKAACLDYSAGLGGPLVCYRWDGESNLDRTKFIWSN